MVFAKFSALVAATALFAVSLASEESAVPSLTSKDFEDTIKGDLTLVKFFAPWCGHCKSMAEPYKEAAAALKGKAVLAEVDATIEKALAEKYGVAGFPTLKLYSKGEELSEYKGARDKESFVKYIERAMLPSVDELADAAAVKEYVSTTNAGKTIYISTKLDKLAATFKKQSMSLRDTIPDGVAFAAVPDAAALADVKKDAEVTDKDSVLVIREDASTAAFAGEDSEKLDSFVKVNSVPLLGELSRGNAQVYTELGLPLALLFQDPKKKHSKVADDITELAAKYRGSDKIGFAWIDAVELKSFMDHLGIADKEIPLAIYEFEGDGKYVYEGDYDKAKYASWIEDFVAGKLEMAKKSEPVPEKNDEPVKVVVGDSWEDIVMDDTKDVLIEQYAPWCGHCKALEPTLTKVATALKDAGHTDIVIAKMDATTNDSPKEYKASGFPTMHFKPKGGKVTSYDGGRSFKDFIDFFKKNAKTKIDDIEEPKEEKKEEKEGEKKEEKEGEGEAKEEGDKDEL